MAPLSIRALPLTSTADARHGRSHTETPLPHPQQLMTALLSPSVRSLAKAFGSRNPLIRTEAPRLLDKPLWAGSFCAPEHAIHNALREGDPDLPVVVYERSLGRQAWITLGQLVHIVGGADPTDVVPGLRFEPPIELNFYTQAEQAACWLKAHVRERSPHVQYSLAYAGLAVQHARACGATLPFFDAIDASLRLHSSRGDRLTLFHNVPRITVAEWLCYITDEEVLALPGSLPGELNPDTVRDIAYQLCESTQASMPDRPAMA